MFSSLFVSIPLTNKHLLFSQLFFHMIRIFKILYNKIFFQCYALVIMDVILLVCVSSMILTDIHYVHTSIANST